MTDKGLPPDRPDPDPRVADWYDMTVCGNCTAARLLHWRFEDGTSPDQVPPNSVNLDPHWAAVHCEHFRRRVELPGQLTYCAAQRERTPGLNRWPRAAHNQNPG